MYNVQGVRASTEQRWNSVMHKLWQQLDHLTDSYTELTASIIPFNEGDAEFEAARQRSRMAYEYMLRQLMEVPIPDEMSDVPHKVAHAWVSNHLPLDVLMQVTSLTYKSFWEALLWNTSKADLPMLAVNAERVWWVVQSLCSEIQAAYTAEAAEIAGARLDDERKHLARLFSDADLGHQQLTAIAGALEVPIDGVFAVAVARQSGHDGLRAARRSLQQRGMRAFLHDGGEHVILLLEVTDADEDTREWFAGTRCAVAPLAQGLENVPRRAALAVRMAEVLPEGEGPAELMDLWDRLVGEDIAAWGADMRSEVLQEVATRDDYEAERIRETVREYLVTGSATTAAARLYCHRNTVINRLRVFREITGLDVTVPRQAAAVVVAMACQG